LPEIPNLHSKSISDLKIYSDSRFNYLAEPTLKTKKAQQPISPSLAYDLGTAAKNKRSLVATNIGNTWLPKGCFTSHH
jgi:hypothetical protein